jgi:hypothetical protein
MLQRSDVAPQIRELARLAQLDDLADAEKLRASLEPFLREVWAGYRVALNGAEIRRRNASFGAAIRRTNLRMYELCEAARRYRLALKEQKDAGQACIDLVEGVLDGEENPEPRSPLPDGIALSPRDPLLRAIDELAGHNLDRPGVVPAQRARATTAKAGRPKGALRKRGLIFECLVAAVLEAVDQAGGTLTFSDSSPETGSLWPALQALEPLLPPKIVPVSPSASQIRRARERWRSAAKNGRTSSAP